MYIYVWKDARQQYDDEIHNCLPERSEGKTKVMWQWYLPFTVLKLIFCIDKLQLRLVATAPTVYGIETDRSFG